MDIEELTKQALTNDHLWDELTSTEERARTVQGILDDFLSSLKEQRTRRAAEVAGSQGTPMQRQVQGEYAEWQRKSSRFRETVKRRRDELKRVRTESARRYLGMIHHESNESLFALANAVEKHQFGALSDAELYRLLDRLTVTTYQRMSLRAALNEGYADDRVDRYELGNINNSAAGSTNRGVGSYRAIPVERN